MDGKIRGGDVIVCRVNGTSDFYLVGTVVSGCVGELSLCGVSTVVGQNAALERAYTGRLQEQRVWLFDGAASAYVKTSSPSPETRRPERLRQQDSEVVDRGSFS
jgi:hypothetical protein